MNRRLSSPSLFVLALLCAAPISATAANITILTVPVGNLGNANDPSTGSHYGAVNYAYNIGTTEVTVGQYTAFLNAVGATDTYAIYDTMMATDLNSGGIARSGSSGSYSYSVIGSANHPVTNVSWGDAARFANWMHNNQPTGAQVVGTTEGGAYFLNGATTSAALNAVSRSGGAQWFIPTESEWYKAAYYQPAAQGGDVDNYWAYPTRTNSEPNSDQPPGIPSIQTNVANFNRDDSLANGFNDGYAVSGSTVYSPSQNYLTDVGAFSSSSSFYGTLDQGGNVSEWNEALLGLSTRFARGGSWNDGSIYQKSSSRLGLDPPTNQFSDVGFRLATFTKSPFPGDTNSDGVVDFTDLNTLLTNYGLPGNFAAGDFDNSGVVDFTDLNKLLTNYGLHAPLLAAAAPVPEPSTLLLAGIGLIGAGVAHRYRLGSLGWRVAP